MKRRLLWAFLWCAFCAGGGWLMSCGAPTFALNVYYWPTPQDGGPDLHRPALQKMLFLVRSPSDARQASWRAVLKQGELQLPALPCPKDPASPTPGLLPGTLDLLPPYVEILAYDKDVSTDSTGPLPESTLVGRFPLEVVCQQPPVENNGRKVAVFLSPPGSLLAWRGASSHTPQDKSWSQRIGHQVTRLPDGRYLVSGGARSLLSTASAASSWKVTWNQSIAVYQPTTGLIEIFDVGLKRAFHTAVWRDNRLFLSGGLAPQGSGVKLTTDVQVLVFHDGTKQWSLRDATSEEVGQGVTSPQRAFHQTIQLPITGSSERQQLVLLGGLTSLPPKTPAASDGLQVLFHTALAIPQENQHGTQDAASSQQRVLMIGGAYRQEDGQMQASQAGLNFLVSAAGKLERTGDSHTIPAVLKHPRAAHAGVALDARQVLVLGGFAGDLTGKMQLQDSLELLRREGETWRSVAQCSRPDDLFSRVFHSMTVLRETTNDVQILVAGGLTRQQRPAPSFLLSWHRDEKNSLCERLQIEVLKQSHTAPVYGMHTATMLETGQVMFLGGATVDPGLPLNFSGQISSAWFTPKPQDSRTPGSN